MADVFDAGLAASEPAAVPLAEPLVPVPMDHLDWSKYIEKEPLEDPGWCFWCHYAQTKEQYASNKNVEKLITFQKENFNKIHPFEFARKMQKLYRKFIQPHLINHAGLVCRGPEWSGPCIVEHTTLHTIHPPDVIEHWVRVIVRSTQVMAEKGIFLGTADQPGVIQGIDSKMFNVFMKTIKEAKPFLDKLGASRNTALYSIS